MGPAKKPFSEWFVVAFLDRYALVLLGEVASDLLILPVVLVVSVFLPATRMSLGQFALGCLVIVVFTSFLDTIVLHWRGSSREDGVPLPPWSPESIGLIVCSLIGPPLAAVLFLRSNHAAWFLAVAFMIYGTALEISNNRTPTVNSSDGSSPTASGWLATPIPLKDIWPQPQVKPPQSALPASATS
ncbi:hypothetical protein KIM372_17220 [Bombiscardovia nodaiensis]|uniref:Uncharacterized protein n=1 Tax=Bombiscardovia nodaiensis TaxID=2932181 RepID=A0ABM8BAH4_9BIFI|nr:hypothetical protein KIM372_17220 [Bombiscardovia nodaiensis]